MIKLYILMNALQINSAIVKTKDCDERYISYFISLKSMSSSITRLEY